MQNLAEHLFPGVRLAPQRIYCNSCQQGDTYLAHRDWPSGSRHVSLVYYANSEWAAEWAGKTPLYDYTMTEPMHAVLPRAGRVLAFHGSIPHRSGAPSKLFAAARYTWVFKFAATPLPLGESC